jgi:hypothetical protein
MTKPQRRTPLTLIEELDIQFQARLRANHGVLLPLSASAPVPLELIEQVREEFLSVQEEEESE